MDPLWERASCLCRQSCPPQSSTSPNIICLEVLFNEFFCCDVSLSGNCAPASTRPPGRANHPDALLLSCFSGVEVPPGDGVEVDVEQGEDFVEMLHLTNVALGSKAKKERVTLFVELPEGQRHAVGSLELGRCEQFQASGEEKRRGASHACLHPFPSLSCCHRVSRPSSLGHTRVAEGGTRVVPRRWTWCKQVCSSWCTRALRRCQ